MYTCQQFTRLYSLLHVGALCRIPLTVKLGLAIQMACLKGTATLPVRISVADLST